MKHFLVSAGILLAAFGTSAAQSASAPSTTDTSAAARSTADRSTAAQAPAHEPPPSEVARIGDQVITLQEVDEAWKASNPGKFAEAIQALYDGRKDTLDRMIAGMLIERAAAARNTTVEKLLEEEIPKRRKPVTAADVETFYAQNTSQMQGEPLEKMRDLITRFLENRRETEARDAYVAELKKAGPPVRVSLEPPRASVVVDSSDPVRGPREAIVTLVEFSDYQCPYCARVTPTLAKLRQTYGDRIRLVWKDFPLQTIHPEAAKASEAAHCAGDQGKYWEFHDRLFANQSQLRPEALKQHAEAVGLDAKAFAACLDSGRHAGRVRQGIEEGKALGVSSTPTVFVNGRAVTGAHSYETFAGIIDDELARAGK